MDNTHFHYRNAKIFTELLDSKFRIGKHSFGLDPILGLVPWGGDIAGLILSIYIIWIALRLRIPGSKVAMMLGNVLYDFLLGIIPILGDIADFVFKANTRNLKILEEFVPGQIYEPTPGVS